MSSELVGRAKAAAEIWHRHQRYGEYPYTKHLQDVHDVLVRYGVNYEPLLAAAWLHDAVEDGKTLEGDRVTVAHLDAQLAGEEAYFEGHPVVTELVWRVTGEGATRRERNQSLYGKLDGVIRREEADARAIRHLSFNVGLPKILKLADRISNVRSCYQTEDTRLFMYYREYPEFRKHVQPEGVGSLKFSLSAEEAAMDAQDKMILRMLIELDRLMDYRFEGKRP